MPTQRLIFIFLLLWHTVVFAQSLHPGLPSVPANAQLIKHTAYTLAYDPQCKIAYWVSYLETREMTYSMAGRTNKFLPDPKCKGVQATNDDYAGSGYDRGHLAPADDMAWSEKTMEESFYLTNMTPQLPSFNRGIWKKLEAKVQDWAWLYDSLYIVTGPVIEVGLNTIGDGVCIPDKFYKALLRIDNNKVYVLGFLMKNEASSQPLTDFVVSIDSLENITGIDFFKDLPDEIENKVESKVRLQNWNFEKINRTGQAIIKDKTNDEHEEKNHDSKHKGKYQCTGITKSGERCKRYVDEEGGKCWQHK